MITFSNDLYYYGHTVTRCTSKVLLFKFRFHILTYSQFKSPTLPSPLHPGPVLPLPTRPDHPCGFCIDWVSKQWPWDHTPLISNRRSPGFDQGAA